MLRNDNSVFLIVYTVNKIGKAYVCGDLCELILMNSSLCVVNKIQSYVFDECD